jgi:hypothetical protein
LKKPIDALFALEYGACKTNLNKMDSPKSQNTKLNVDSNTISGMVYAASAFLIWGICPIYWKALRAVPALEIILHRVVWSFFFLVPIIMVMRRSTMIICCKPVSAITSIRW